MTAVTCFTRFSLPVFLSPPTKRVLPSPAALSAVPQRFRPPHRLTSSRNYRPTFVRSEAADGSVDAVVAPQTVPVAVAHELLQAGRRYLDVRTEEEFNSGHPIGAVNIPYMFKSGSGMTKNPIFLKEVSSVFEKDDQILVGCMSGKRSLMAATELSSAGFTGITDVGGGYSAWAQNGLPTEK